MRSELENPSFEPFEGFLCQKVPRYANAIVDIVGRVKNDHQRALLKVTVSTLENFKLDSQHAIKTALKRDPIDAEQLAYLLTQRAQEQTANAVAWMAVQRAQGG